MTTYVEKQWQRINNLHPEELIRYINLVSTASKKGSFYHAPVEQVMALNDSIGTICDMYRPFAVLMLLSDAITDDARAASMKFLLDRTLMMPSVSPAQKTWECAVFLDAMKRMPPTRVFDLFSHLIGYRHVTTNGKTRLRSTAYPVGGRYTKGLATRWLADNLRRLDLWTVKYTKDFQRLARHLHLKANWVKGLSWLFGGPPVTDLQKCVAACHRAGKGEVPTELWSLPYENARGFALSKCMLKPEEFEKEFSNRGTKTKKEARTSAARTSKAGGTVTYDPSRANDVFELLVWMGGQDCLPDNARELLAAAAKRQATKIGIKLNQCGVVLDTSASMAGTSTADRHPLFRGLATAKILEACSGKFKLCCTTEQSVNAVIPSLHGCTSYTESVESLIASGFTQIFIIGDGYENSPSGEMDQYMKALEKVFSDKIHIIQLNPVAAPETPEGIKEMSTLIPYASLPKPQALPTAMFMAIARTNPALAVAMYYEKLVQEQSPATRELMLVEHRTLLDSLMANQWAEGLIGT